MEIYDGGPTLHVVAEACRVSPRHHSLPWWTRGAEMAAGQLLEAVEEVQMRGLREADDLRNNRVGSTRRGKGCQCLGQSSFRKRISTYGAVHVIKWFLVVEDRDAPGRGDILLFVGFVYRRVRRARSRLMEGHR